MHLDWENDHVIYEKIENKYWDLVENQIGANVKVEYAADLNANKFGSGFGTKD